ncbi:MAG: PH domain-containing protein [Desulfotomaculaceae bacterium]
MRTEPAERLDPRALQVWIISGVIKTTVLAVMLGGSAAVALMFFHWPGWVPVIPSVVVMLYGTLEIGVLPELLWKHWHYEVSEEEVDLQRGIWLIKRTLIPLARVQHVDTRQGIIMRRYNLASVAISTAAGVHEIPALSVEVADELRDKISRLARTYENEL